MSVAFVWLIALATIAGILFRPKNWPEAIWACLGAALLIVFRLLPASLAGSAILKGTDVYLFLTGMMLLAELARREGVFDWLASLAVAAAKGSPLRLFALIYLVGTAVTICLSNDATAVVLTPAVYAAVKRAGAKPLPYLLICAFIANAASFVLPISNPANLVVYGKNLPPLLPWLATFLLPSACSVIATFFVLRWFCRGDIANPIENGGEPHELSPQGCIAAWGIAATGAIVIAASALGRDLGFPTCLAALVTLFITTKVQPRPVTEILKSVSWSVLPLVAGLFVLVEALARVGARDDLGRLLSWCQSMPRYGGLVASFGIAVLSNLTNNLPSGLLAGAALQAHPVSANIRDAVLIGVDLGPNLSVTGSLATVLWLIALRREGEHINGWQFLKAGSLVMPPALLLAVLSLFLVAR